MIRNYLVTAWRHIINNRLFAAINMLGLALGILSCVLIMLFVLDELSYDNWVPNGDRVVRMHTGFYMPDRPPFETVSSAGRMMPALSSYASDQVEAGVRLVTSDFTILTEGRTFTETVTVADGSFFSVFALPFLHGDASTSFRKPMDVVLTESQAIKHFGRSDVVGEVLTVCCLSGEKLELQVTGVLQDLPENTHLALDILVFLEPSMFDAMPNILNTWTSVNTYTYFKLKPGRSVQEFQGRVTYWLDYESPLREMVGPDVVPSSLVKLKIMSLRDLHLRAIRDAGSMGDMKPMGNFSTVIAFASIAALILVLASINFMNLSTARASMRAKEVAIRKIMGASRRQLIVQFIGEAVLISLFALLIALVGVELLLSAYSDSVGKSLTTEVFENGIGVAVLIGVALLLGVVSGTYPALYLSRYLPAHTLKSTCSASTGQNKVRSVLVVVQFSATIFLAACTLVIYGQTLYARSMDVGYEYQDKLVLEGLNGSQARRVRESLVEELKRIDGVTSVTVSSEVPSQDRENNTGFQLLNPPEGARADGVIINYHTVGSGFMEAYGINLVAGRYLSEYRSTDMIRPVGLEEVGNAATMINVSAARQLGFSNPVEAIGHVLRASIVSAGTQELEIVGVVEDVFFRSLKFEVRPSVYFDHPELVRAATLNFKTNDLAGLTVEVDAVWQKLVPATPISREFLTEMVYAQYEAEESQAQLFSVFSLLALIIGCLGLYGLASFAAERRTREIGIRKVMGARVLDIVRLLVWQFSLPVLFANFIACPLAIYAMHQWLQGFSYRIDTSLVLLAAFIAGVVALGISWLTVAARALKVANAKPIHALRYE